jgi:hypothetical protein
LKNKIFRIIQTIVLIGLGVFFIFFFWGKLDADQQTKVVENFKKANYFWMFLALIAGILSHILRAARWNLLISTIEKPPSVKNSFWSLMAGYLANLAVPRLGEITRAMLLSRRSKISFDKLFGTVVAERAFDFFFFILLFFVAIAAFWHNIEVFVTNRILGGLDEKIKLLSNGSIWIITTSFIILFCFVFWLLKKYKNKPFIAKINRFIHNLISGLMSIFKLKNAFLFLSYTLLIWLLYWLMVYLMYFSIPSTSNLSVESAFIVLVFGTIGIIVIQGGIGIYPLIVSEVLLIYGADITDGFTIGWLSWSVQTIMIIIMGLIAFTLFGFKKNNKDEFHKINQQ